MKVYKVIKWVLKASVLTMVIIVMQACNGSPFRMEEMRGRSYEQTEEVDDTPSEDLEFWGLNNEDWQSVDDPIVE